MPVLPRPLHLRTERGAAPFALRVGCQLHHDPAAGGAAQQLQRWLADLVGVEPDLVAPAGPAPSGMITLRVTEEDTPARSSPQDDERYALRIAATGIELTAPAPAGLVRGAATLAQLAFAGRHGATPPKPTRPGPGTAARGHTPAGAVLPATSVIDRPRYAHRGLLLDVARHFHDRDTVVALLPLLALCKLNVLHLHLTDDQGWRLPVPGYPELTRIGGHRRETRGDGRPHGGAYTRTDLDVIVATARALHLDVVPEIDLPGHLGAAIAAIPSLACRAEPQPVWTRFGINPVIACAGRDATLDILTAAIDAAVAAFPGPLVHLGGDEVPKTAWRQCPDCRARQDAEGLPSEAHLQAWLLDRLSEHATRRGRRVVVWNDGVLPEVTRRDVIMQFWREPRGAPRARAEVAAGREVIVSDLRHAYLDLPHGVVPLRAALAFDPLQLSAGDPTKVRGVEAALWSELVPDTATLHRRLWPKLGAIAEAGWTDARLRESTAARQRLDRFTELLEALDVVGEDPGSVDPRGVRRLPSLARHLRGVLDGPTLRGLLAQQWADHRADHRAEHRAGPGSAPTGGAP